MTESKVLKEVDKVQRLGPSGEYAWVPAGLACSKLLPFSLPRPRLMIRQCIGPEKTFSVINAQHEASMSQRVPPRTKGFLPETLLSCQRR